MSDAVQIELIRSAASAVPASLTALGVIIGAYFSYHSAKYARSAAITSKETAENTNHMKDELVAAVSAERYAAGVKDEAGRK